MIEQLPHDPAAEEASSAEDRDQPSVSVPSRGLIHCLPASQAKGFRVLRLGARSHNARSWVIPSLVDRNLSKRRGLGGFERRFARLTCDGFSLPGRGIRYHKISSSADFTRLPARSAPTRPTWHGSKRWTASASG